MLVWVSCYNFKVVQEKTGKPDKDQESEQNVKDPGLKKEKSTTKRERREFKKE